MGESSGVEKAAIETPRERKERLRKKAEKILESEEVKAAIKKFEEDWQAAVKAEVVFENLAVPAIVVYDAVFHSHATASLLRFFIDDEATEANVAKGITMDNVTERDAESARTLKETEGEEVGWTKHTKKLKILRNSYSAFSQKEARSLIFKLLFLLVLKFI